MTRKFEKFKKFEIIFDKKKGNKEEILSGIMAVCMAVLL